MTEGGSGCAAPQSSGGRAFGFHLYDLTYGAALTYGPLLPLVEANALTAIYHSAVVLDGFEYFFEGGVARRPQGRTRFGTSCLYLGGAMYSTTKSRREFEEWIAAQESVGKYGLLSYRVISANCHAFCEDACRFLTDGKSGTPPQLCGNVDSATSFPLGFVVRDVLERLTIGGVNELAKAVKKALVSMQDTRNVLSAVRDALGPGGALGTHNPPATIFVSDRLRCFASGAAGESTLDGALALLRRFVLLAARAAVMRCDNENFGVPPPEDRIVTAAIAAARCFVMEGRDRDRLHANAASLLCDAIAVALDNPDVTSSDDDSSSSSSSCDDEEPPAAHSTHHRRAASRFPTATVAPVADDVNNLPFGTGADVGALSQHRTHHDHLQGHSGAPDTTSDALGRASQATRRRQAHLVPVHRTTGESFGVSEAARVPLFHSPAIMRHGTTIVTPGTNEGSEGRRPRAALAVDDDEVCVMLSLWTALMHSNVFATVVAHHGPLRRALRRLLAPGQVPRYTMPVLQHLLELTCSLFIYPVAGNYLKRTVASGVIALIEAGLFAHSWDAINMAAALFNNMVLLNRHFTLTTLREEIKKGQRMHPVVRAAMVVRVALRSVFPTAQAIIEHPKYYLVPNARSYEEQKQFVAKHSGTLKAAECEALLEIEQAALTKLQLGLVHLFAEAPDTACAALNDSYVPRPETWAQASQCATPLNHDLRRILHCIITEELPED